jgi:predicted transcriptional regulator
MTRKKITFYVSEEMNAWLDGVAEAQAQSKSELLNEILEDVKTGFEEDEEDTIANYIYENTYWFNLDEQ